MTATEWVIREATEADDEAIGELLVKAFVEQYRRKLPEVEVTSHRKEELRAVAQKRAVAKVWVTEAGRSIAGTVALWSPGASGSEAFLEGAADLRHLAVAAPYRKCGVSKDLLDTAEAWARTIGCKAVCLHIRRGAVGVARLYESRGYQRDPAGDLDFLPEVFLEAYHLSFERTPAAAPLSALETA
jgi:GNAT superfamily N-acetyltransferase